MRNRYGGLDLTASAAALLLLIFCILALLAPLVAPHDPTASTLSARLLPPVWSEGGRGEYLLGTDHLGRDVLSRLIYGARVSLAVALRRSWLQELSAPRSESPPAILAASPIRSSCAWSTPGWRCRPWYLRFSWRQWLDKAR